MDNVLCTVPAVHNHQPRTSGEREGEREREGGRGGGIGRAKGVKKEQAKGRSGKIAL